MDSEIPSLADLIRVHRKSAQLTQIELADLAGVGKTVVFDLEHGKETIQWDTLSKILHALNIKVTFVSPFSRTVNEGKHEKS